VPRDALKPVHWIGSSRDDLRSFPGPVQRSVGYTVRFAEVVYVLHAFQKKARKGKATPKHEIALIRSRYEAARAHHEARFGGA
jgi:phage-related protein